MDEWLVRLYYALSRNAGFLFPLVLVLGLAESLVFIFFPRRVKSVLDRLNPLRIRTWGVVGLVLVVGFAFLYMRVIRPMVCRGGW